MSVDCPQCDRSFDSHRAKSVHASHVHKGRVPSIRCDPYGHRTIDTKHKGDRYRVQLHRLHATLLVDDLAELDGKEIHHQNGCPFDNRLENYELVDREEHRAKSLNVCQNFTKFKILCRACGEAVQVSTSDGVRFCSLCGSQLGKVEIARSEPIDWRISH